MCVRSGSSVVRGSIGRCLDGGVQVFGRGEYNFV